jgi:hypothetical protein
MLGSDQLQNGLRQSISLFKVIFNRHSDEMNACFAFMIASTIHFVIFHGHEA